MTERTEDGARPEAAPRRGRRHASGRASEAADRALEAPDGPGGFDRDALATIEGPTHSDQVTGLRHCDDALRHGRC